MLGGYCVYQLGLCNLQHSLPLTSLGFLVQMNFLGIKPWQSCHSLLLYQNPLLLYQYPLDYYIRTHWITISRPTRLMYQDPLLLYQDPLDYCIKTHQINVSGSTVSGPTGFCFVLFQIFFIRYFLYLHFKCYTLSQFPLQKFPIPFPLPMFTNSPTSTSWPWHFPYTGILSVRETTIALFLYICES